MEEIILTDAEKKLIKLLRLLIKATGKKDSSSATPDGVKICVSEDLGFGEKIN